MKIVCFNFVFLFFISIFGVEIIFGDNLFAMPQEIVMATTANNLSYYSNPTDALQLIERFAEYLTQRLGIYVKVEILADFNTMSQRLGERSIDLGLMGLKEYISLHRLHNVVPKVRASRVGKEGDRAVICVRKDSKIRQIINLKGRKFAYVEENDLIDFQNKFLAREDIPFDNFFGKLIEVDGGRNEILAVYFGEADAVCLSLTQWEIMAELNPGIMDKLTPIAYSDFYVFTPIFFRKDFNQELTQKVTEEILHAHEIAEGETILLFFKIEKFVKAKASDYEPIRKFYDKIGVKY